MNGPLAALLTSIVGMPASALPPADGAPPESPRQRAQLRLVTSSESVSPGSSVDVGVSFAIEPGWHLYWDGRNDTGQPPTVKLDLPKGVTAGPTLWPAPKRHVLPGDILDHIYENEVTLIITVSIAQDLAPGTRLQIHAACSWMVCRSECVLEDGTANATILVAKADGGTPAKAAGAELISRARGLLPKPFTPDSGSVRFVDSEAESSKTAMVRVPGATALEFYPASDCSELTDPIADSKAASDQLSVRLKLAQHIDKYRLKGILAVFKKDAASPVYYVLDADAAR